MLRTAELAKGSATAASAGIHPCQNIVVAAAAAAAAVALDIPRRGIDVVVPGDDDISSDLVYNKLIARAIADRPSIEQGDIAGHAQ